jgi:Phage tail sheath protein subtilisin-like domain
MQFEDASPTPNFMWHAARAFFENGGTRLYVSRVFSPGARSNSDGRRPTAADYAGALDPPTNRKTALMAFEEVDEISTIAAPGVTFGCPDNSADARSILNLLIAQAEQMRYRIAVLDSGNGQSLDEVEAFRANFNSRYATLYYPWVTVHDPPTGASLNLPPSGFIAGIYARTDVTRGVFESPANEVINLAIGLETILDDTQQSILNPLGINTLRFFPAEAISFGAPAPSPPIPNGNTSPSAATSLISSTPSTTAHSGSCSNPTARGCGPMFVKLLLFSFPTSGAVAP